MTRNAYVATAICMVTLAMAVNADALAGQPVAGGKAATPHVEARAAKGTTRTFSLPILTVRQRLSGKWQGKCAFLPMSVSIVGNTEPLRISFSDDTPGGSGETIRNSLWMAALNAALQKESALQGVRITLDFKGGMDGPSAGAMMCLGIMTALDGRDFPNDFAMTGTILPDGTVGLVGGVPEKLKAAAKDAQIKRVAIPAFQRFDCDANGKWTDLYELGRSLGLEVRPVESIGDAYRFLHREPVHSELQLSALSVCRETSDFEMKAAEIFQKRAAALRGRLVGLSSNDFNSVSQGREWNDINPRIVERRFEEGAIFDALNMVARADAHLSAYLESWKFYRDYQNEFLRDADAKKKETAKALRDTDMHEWPIAQQLAYVDGFRKRIKDICETALDWRRESNEDAGGKVDEKTNDDDAWSGFVPETGSSDLAAQLLSIVDACRAEGRYRYMDRQTFNRKKLENALKSGDRNIYDEIDYDRKKLFFLMCERFIKPGLRGVPLPIRNCGPEVGSALELFRRAWLITDAMIETDVVRTWANRASTHQDDVRKWLVSEDPIYAVYDTAKRWGNLSLELLDETKEDGIVFKYSGWTDANLMFFCADLFAESSALLLKLDHSTDNASFMAFVTDRARANALKSMEACRKAGIPCFASVLAFQKAERGRSDKKEDVTSVLANYWKATMSSKALVMAFKNGKGPKEGFNGYPAKPEEIAAKRAMETILNALLNAELKPFLDSLPSDWVKAVSDAAAGAAQTMDEDAWKAVMGIMRQSGQLMIKKSDLLAEFLIEEDDDSSIPLSKADARAIIENWGGTLLGFHAVATREKVAAGRLAEILLAPKQGIDKKKNDWRTLPFPEIVAHVQSDGDVEVTIPAWEGAAFVPGLSDVSPDIFSKKEGKWVMKDLSQLFDNRSSWRSQVVKALNALGSHDTKTLMQRLQGISATLKKAESCTDAKSLAAVFGNLQQQLSLETIKEYQGNVEIQQSELPKGDFTDGHVVFKLSKGWSFGVETNNEVVVCKLTDDKNESCITLMSALDNDSKENFEQLFSNSVSEIGIKEWSRQTLIDKETSINGHKCYYRVTECKDKDILLSWHCVAMFDSDTGKALVLQGFFSETEKGEKPMMDLLHSIRFHR